MTDRSNRPPRRWTLVAAAGLVGLLVVGAVFVALSGPSDDDDAQSAGTPTYQSATSAASPTPTGDSTGQANNGCGVTDTEQQPPEAAPTGVTWNLWKGVALPTSQSAGPLDVDDEAGVTGCYAHTPTGAVMAAININLRALLAAPDTRIVDEQVTGPYKSQFRAYLERSEPPSPFPQVAGFRTVSYTSSQATIKLALGPESGLQAGNTTLLWSDGTWKMLATADDLDNDTLQRPDNLSGFVPFQGIG